MTKPNYSDFPTNGLLRARDVAAFCSVSVTTIYRWFDMGILDGIKIGRTLRFTRHDVLKLSKQLENGKRKS
jgi:excisionase family DNA binding protein